MLIKKKVLPLQCIERISLSSAFGIVSWCNGSTTGFGSVCQGSNPCETTKKEELYITKAPLFCYKLFNVLLMKLAVIMSVFRKDHAVQLREAIKSILDQSYKDFHFYIMEDGILSDELKDALYSFSDDPRIFIRHRDENKGLAYSLNELLREILAKDYECIARMDADDISVPNRFQRQIEELEKDKNLDSIGSFAIEIDNYNRELFHKIMPISHDDCRRFFRKRACYIHPSVMFRRSFFEKAGLYYEHSFYSEDAMLWLEGFKNGCKFANIPEYLLLFRINDGFYERRSGLKYAKNIFKIRCLISKEMNYGLIGYIYAFFFAFSKLLPNKALRLLYKIRNNRILS